MVVRGGVGLLRLAAGAVPRRRVIVASLSRVFASVLRTQEEEILDREGLSPRGRLILADLDRWNRATRWYAAHVRRVRLHWEALGRPSPFRVLDVGTGSGGLLAALAESDIPCELVGVDRSPAFA